MSAEIRELLRRVAPPVGEPDLIAIQRRARRRAWSQRLLGVAFITVVGSAGWFAWDELAKSSLDTLPNTASVGERARETSTSDTGLASPAERAATVAIAALHSAGLQHPGSTYFDYGEVQENDDGWIAYFCSSPPEGGVCRSDTADSSLTVTKSGDQLTVTTASGKLSDDATILIGHSESASPPAPGLIFGPFEPASWGEGSGAVEAAVYWTGAIPSHLEATCRFQALDDEGNVTYQGREFPETGPMVEGARDGVFGAELPSDVNASTFRVACSGYRSSPPEPSPSLPDGPAQTIASGTFDRGAGGEFGGVSWRIVIWSEVHRYCWALQTGSESEDMDKGFTCTPRDLDVDDAFRGWGYAASEDNTQAVASGAISVEVEQVEIRLDTGDVIPAEIVQPPADLDISERFFVAFIPSLTEGVAVGIDAKGHVLETFSLHVSSQEQRD